MKRTCSLVQAATVLNSLRPSQAAKVLSRLEPADIKTVLGAMTRLDYVSAFEISNALRRLSKETQTISDSDELPELNSQINSALDELKSELEKSAEPENPFAFLINVIPLVRNHLLADEHPKNVAIVLSMLPPTVASITLEGLDDQIKVSVLKRLCEIDEIQRNEVAELRFALKQRLHRLMNSGQLNEDGINSAIKLLSCSESGMRDKLLAQVRQTDPDLAYKLQRSAFKIVRLITLENAEIKVILRHVDAASWAPALKNSPEELVDKILSNMAMDPSNCLRLEIAEIGFVDKPIEELARQNIVQVVLRLGRERVIELRKNGPRETTDSQKDQSVVEVFPVVGQSSLSAWDATSLMRSPID